MAEKQRISLGKGERKLTLQHELWSLPPNFRVSDSECLIGVHITIILKSSQMILTSLGTNLQVYNMHTHTHIICRYKGIAMLSQ